MKTTQLINQLDAQLITIKSGGLTIFAPDDSSFSNLKVGFLNSLADNQKIELLQFHVLPTYVSSSNFDSLSNPVRTLAGDNPDRLQLNVTAYGNNVNISTGVVNATITGVIYSDKVLAIYHVDKVLLPLDFFKPKPPAPAPSPSIAPKTDNDNSSADDSLGTSKDSSGAWSLTSSLGTTLVSLGFSLVALVIISSWRLDQTRQSIWWFWIYVLSLSSIDFEGHVSCNMFLLIQLRSFLCELWCN